MRCHASIWRWSLFFGICAVKINWRQRVDHPRRIFFQIDVYAAAAEGVPIRFQPVPQGRDEPDAGYSRLAVGLPETATLAQSIGKDRGFAIFPGGSPTVHAMAHHTIERCP